MGKLTAKGIEAKVAEAKATGKNVEWPDGDGLTLRVGPRRASWRFKYYSHRPNVHVPRGKARRMLIGYYPEVSLAAARLEVAKLKVRIRDPKVRADPFKEAAAVASGLTFRELALQRLTVKGDEYRLRPKTVADYTWAFEKYAFPAFGGLPAATVTAPAVIALADRIAEKAPVTADRVVAAISSVYAWAMRRQIVRSNPARGLERRSSNLDRERVLTEDELRRLLAGIMEVMPTTRLTERSRLTLLLLLHTGQRSSEVRLATGPELRWDGVDLHGTRFSHPCWVIPGDRRERGVSTGGRTKSGREQVLPLSKQAAGLFRKFSELAPPFRPKRPAEPRNPHYPAGHRPDYPIMVPTDGHQAVARAFSRICERAGIEDASPHDLRRTCATWLGGRGEREEVVSSVLNHAPRGVTKSVYDRSRLLPLMLEAMQAWSDHVQSLMPAKQA